MKKEIIIKLTKIKRYIKGVNALIYSHLITKSIDIVLKVKTSKKESYNDMISSFHENH